MKYILTVPALLCAGLATPVAAQSADNGFYAHGFAELNYFDTTSGSTSETFGYTQTTLGYADPDSGFGVEFGVDALITDAADFSAIYGAVTYQSSFGKLSFGVPRPALDDYLASVPTVGGLTFLDVSQTSLTKRSFITNAYLQADNEVPLGLRYDGTFGATTVGASYSRFDDLNIFDIAANHQFGQTMLMGGLENVSDNTLSETRYFLGVESRFGQISAGLLFSGNVSFADETATEVYAKYKPLDQLELTATALNIDFGGGNSTLYGLAADYTLNQGIYLKAGVADSFESGSTTAYNLAVGLRF